VKIIESTDEMTEIGGVPVRHWKGVTDDGVACHVFVHRVAVSTQADNSRFEKELSEIQHVRTIPLSSIL